MKLYKLTQINPSDFPGHVYCMLISAHSENQARVLAMQNEREHRDGAQFWVSEHARCEEVNLPEPIAGVYLVS